MQYASRRDQNISAAIESTLPPTTTTVVTHFTTTQQFFSIVQDMDEELDADIARSKLTFSGYLVASCSDCPTEQLRSVCKIPAGQHQQMLLTWTTTKTTRIYALH